MCNTCYVRFYRARIASQKPKPEPKLKIYKSPKPHRYNSKEWKRNRGIHKSKHRGAMPIWANKEAIKNFYANCPEGYDVDHIIPLNGKNVCGLHVHNNLQYLLPIANLIKGNKH